MGCIPSVKEKKALIEAGHKEIPVVRQCELLGLSRSAYYLLQGKAWGQSQRGPYEASGRTIHQDALLRCAEDDRVAEETGLRSQS